MRAGSARVVVITVTSVRALIVVFASGVAIWWVGGEPRPRAPGSPSVASAPAGTQVLPATPPSATRKPPDEPSPDDPLAALPAEGQGRDAIDLEAVRAVRISESSTVMVPRHHEPHLPATLSARHLPVRHVWGGAPMIEPG